jgi:glutathione synthase/RimK-type ligase-like ATP-grasp enzyme
LKSPRIAIGTCRTLPEPDVDEPLLNEALRAHGAEPVMVAWDANEPTDFSDFDLCVLRSTWNYIDDPERFQEWLRTISGHIPLFNSLETLLWNLDKKYLAELEKAGVAIVPTFWATRGNPVTFEDEIEARGWDEIVIKPTISAGSFETHRFAQEELSAASATLKSGLAERDWMVQKYMPAVETTGERALVIIDGEITHSVRKSPRFTGDAESISEALVPSAEERMFATQVLELIPALTGQADPLLYARVDVIPDSDGTLLLAELELLEPSLFFKQSPPALERFVTALLARTAR